jgi:hypothetical protein
MVEPFGDFIPVPARIYLLDIAAGSGERTRGRGSAAVFPNVSDRYHAAGMGNTEIRVIVGEKGPPSVFKGYFVIDAAAVFRDSAGFSVQKSEDAAAFAGLQAVQDPGSGIVGAAAHCI